MRRKLKISYILAAVMTVSGCSKTEYTDRGFPEVTTDNASVSSGVGALLGAKIHNPRDYKILNYGFVWSDSQVPTLETCDRVIFSAKNVPAEFSASVVSTLKDQTSYFVRSFLLTSDFTVYGNVQEFTARGSLGPTIESFYPSSGHKGDTITITGKNFSYLKEKNIVTFSFKQGRIIYASDTLLLTEVPTFSAGSTLRIFVSVTGSASVPSFDNFFTYLNN